MKKVSRGDPLKISAETFNGFVDAANAHRENQFSRSAPTAKNSQPGIIRVKNNSGAACARYSVLGISGVVVSPTDNLGAFQDGPTVTGITPTIASMGAFVVLAEPITSGGVGRAYISGMCVAKLCIVSASDTTADVYVGNGGYLRTGCGSARILWKEAGTGVNKWGLVELGGGGGIQQYIAEVDSNATGGGYYNCHIQTLDATDWDSTTADQLDDTGDSVVVLNLVEVGTSNHRLTAGKHIVCWKMPDDEGNTRYVGTEVFGRNDLDICT